MNYFPIKDLKRAEYNPRIMPDADMQSLMKSIETHGFVEPIVVNVNKDRYGVIVGGHQRLTAVEKLVAKGAVPKGIEAFDNENSLVPMSTANENTHWSIPCFEVDLTLEAEKQLNIGLNKIHGKFDEEKLFSLIVEMKESPTLPTTGFREDEISQILDRNLEDDEEDDGENLPLEAQSKPGEIYELGNHRLICGDSTDPETYRKLLGENKADMIWSDPPYNVAYVSRGEQLASEGKSSIKNDKMDEKNFEVFIDAVFANIKNNLKAGSCYYLCSGYGSYPIFFYSLQRTGLHLSSVIMWIKTGAQMAGWQEYHRRHEQIIKGEKKDSDKKAKAIIYGWEPSQTHKFYGDFEYDVWEMPRKSISNYLHPTEKPDWLPMRAIRNSTKRNDIVLDPFSGSGSVMSACEKTGRRAYMIELDPKFCDVIRNRYARIKKAQETKNGNSN